jgi:hypothetical protein
MWSNDVVSTVIGFSSDLKMGQYLKVRLGFNGLGASLGDQIRRFEDSSSFHVHSSTLGNGNR